MKRVIYVGMDVHKETITLASIAEGRKNTIAYSDETCRVTRSKTAT